MSYLEESKQSKHYIESQFMESFVSYIKDALQKLSDIFKQNNISFTVIGGIARNEYASSSTTEDIDFLIDKKDFSKMKKLPIGFIRDISDGRARVFSLHDPKTKVEVIYSGEKAGDKRGIMYPSPEEVSELHDGIPFLTLKDLIRFKLSSGKYANRYKDYSDIQALIKENNLSKNYALKNNFREDLILVYENIWNKTLN